MTYSVDLLRVAPRATDIKPEACIFSEAYFLLFLSNCILASQSVTLREHYVTYGKGKTTTASIITKSGSSTGFETSLVLKCGRKQILEGMITSSDKKCRVIRPFCGAADYSKRQRPTVMEINRDLKCARERLGIKEENSVEMLLRLFAMGRLLDQIGPSFNNNIDLYTQYVLDNKIHVGRWLEPEEISIPVGDQYPEI